MKTFISLFALILSLSLTAQSNPAYWFLNDTSGNGFQSSILNTASGNLSLATGFSTTASGSLSTAMGFGTTSSDTASLVVGQYNLAGETVTSSATEFSLDNTAFVIGNGIANDARSDAFKVMFNGDATLAGSMTATSFIGDGSQLTNLPSSGGDSPFSYNSNDAGGIEVADYTTASGSLSTAMGEQTIASGEISTAMGFQTIAIGDASTAMGDASLASGYVSTAMGSFTNASGNTSTAMGSFTDASGIVSTAMGRQTTASGDYSTAMGYYSTASDYASLVVGKHNLEGYTVAASATEFSLYNTALVIGNGADSDNRSDALVVKFNGDTTLAGSMTATSFIGDGSQLTNLPFSYNSNESGGIEVADYTTASGSRAFAVGNDNLASGSSSTAMGRGTIASGEDSTAMGYGTIASGLSSSAIGERTTASGYYSTAMGVATNAEDYNSFSIGRFNKIDETPNPDSFSYQNTAFVIGNGGNDDEGNYDGHRSNAFEVLFDGTTTIAGDLNVNSDARLKANIISLGSTLSKLLQIDGKSYTMKKDESEKQKIGLLAQDIEKVFPELVSESNGIKSVNYQGLVPVLINALKEQQSEIEELKTMLKTLIEKT